MSKYLEVKTEFKSVEALVAALEEWAKETGKVWEDCRERPKHLQGYTGDTRPETAHFIIRRNHVGSSANDVGFQIKDDGTIQAHISEYDRPRGGKAILDYLTESYAEHNVIDLARARGYTVAKRWRDEKTGERRIQFTGYTN